MKEQICKLIDSFMGCSLKYKVQIKELDIHTLELKTKIGELDNNVEKLIVQKQDLLIEQEQITERLNLCELAYKNPTYIPEKSIKYQRNVWLGKNFKWVKKAISVRNFITINDDEIKLQLKARKFFINEDLSNFNTMVPKIYKEAKKGRYMYDDGYGYSENWWFPFELTLALSKGLGGDCEDYAHKIVSWLRVAGVSPDRVFVSCGTTRSGFGHSTVYVRDSEGTWRHLNSTTPTKKYTDLTKYPSKNDDTDSIGIHPDKFWFSFNDRISISEFETQEAQKLFNQEEAMKKVIIT